MKKRQSGRAAAVLYLIMGLAAGTAAFAQMRVGQGEGLSALMERNREHFQQTVQTAYFEGVTKQLQKADYQLIRQQAQAIAAIALQARQDFSRGEKFDELAGKLEQHAQATAEAAAGENLPETNIEIGEMAEYCAECHGAFRW